MYLYWSYCIEIILSCIFQHNMFVQKPLLATNIRTKRKYYLYIQNTEPNYFLECALCLFLHGWRSGWRQALEVCWSLSQSRRTTGVGAEQWRRRVTGEGRRATEQEIIGRGERPWAADVGCVSTPPWRGCWPRSPRSIAVTWSSTGDWSIG